MTPMVVAVAASFLVGSFGYVLFRFWVRPIYQYRIIRRKVMQHLADYMNAFDQEDEGENFYGAVEERALDIRRYSLKLTECFNDTLPTWYQVLLKGRGEYPEEITKHLVALSNTRNYYHARNRMEKIRTFFRM